MMKKLLMLVLVLGMGTLASAGIMISGPTQLSPSGNAMITVSSDTPIIGGWGGYVAILLPQDMQLGADGEWTGNYSVNQDMPVGPTFEVTYYGDFRPDFPWDLWYVDMTNPSVDPTPAGEYASFEFHCTGPLDVEIIVTNLDGVELDRLVISQIPEPASMLLLGLGGLFLRRRK